MRLVSCVAAFAFLLAPVALGKDAPKSVQVDCTKGQSINATLADSAEALVVEFSGVCAEDVAIRRGAVTLRGSAPGAKISGAASPAVPAAAVLIRGVGNVTLQNFAVQDGDRRGIDVVSASAVTLDGIVADGNFSDGLRLLEGSSVFVRNSSFDQNGGDGIGVWQNSNVVFEGAISLDGNRIGLLLSGGSDASVTFSGVQMTANGNSHCGYVLQLGAAAQVGAAGPTTVTASGNGACGVSLLEESAWAGPLTVQNSPVGVDLTSSTFESAELSATGATTALFARLGSYVALRTASVTGNQTGIRLDGANAQIDATNLQGNGTDLRLQFGARASFNAASSAATVSCDSTVLVRGPVTCPPSALAAERTSSLQSQDAPASRTPFELLPE